MASRAGARIELPADVRSPARSDSTGNRIAVGGLQSWRRTEMMDAANPSTAPTIGASRATGRNRGRILARSDTTAKTS